MMKTALFDMDGTLLNSMIYWNQSGIEVVKEFGLSVNEGEYSMMKMSATELVDYLHEMFGVKITKADLINRWQAKMRNHYANDITIKPYVKELLEHYRQKGIRMAVVTGTPSTIATKVLKQLEILPYFEFVLSEDMVGASKRFPDIYLSAMKQLNGTLDSTIVFEDALHAASTAKKAGFYVVGVSDEVSKDAEPILRSLCDQYILSFAEML